MRKVSLLVLLSMILSVMCMTFTACNGGDDQNDNGGVSDTGGQNNDNQNGGSQNGGNTGTTSHTHEDADGNEVCDTCSEELVHKNHTFGEAWAFDAENHYHVCDKCNVKDSSAAHADDNNDGECDTCAIIMENNHVFDKNWTYDATSHWHEPLCGHALSVKDKAAHTIGILGNCTVCDYEGTGPNPTTVAEAIEVAKLTQGTVIGGKFTSVLNGYSESLNFEFGNGYFHAYNYDQNTHTYATLNDDGTVCYISFDPNHYMSLDDVFINTSADAGYVNGYALDLNNFINEAVKLYGAVELLEFFYSIYPEAKATEDAPAEVTENVENGVYSFSYSVMTIPALYMPLTQFDITVEFTLDEEKYFIDTLSVHVDEHDNTYFYKVFDYEQWERPKSDHTVEDITPTDWTLYEKDGETPINITSGTASTVNATPGKYNVYIGIDAPATALLEVFKVTVAIKDADGVEIPANTVYAHYNSSAKAIEIDFKAEGTYYAHITVGPESYVIPFAVAYIAPTAIYPMVYDEGQYGYVYSDYIEIYEGETIKLGATLSEGSKPNMYSAKKTGTNASNASLGRLGLVDNGVGGQIGAFNFKSDVPGTYTVTFTSTVDSNVSSEITIEVIEKLTVNEVAQGKWTAGGTAQYQGKKYIVNFYPEDAANTKGAITADVELNGDINRAVFTYTIIDDVFVATLVEGSNEITSIGVSYLGAYINPGQSSEITLKNVGDADTKPSGLPTVGDTGASNVIEVQSGSRLAYYTTKTYKVAIAAGEIASFSFTAPDTMTSSYNITLTFTGDATAWNASVTPKVSITSGHTFTFDVNENWLVSFDFQNSTASEVTVEFTVAWEEVIV